MKKQDDPPPLLHNLNKSTVLQQARTFNETPLIPRKCAIVLTRLTYLLHQGETLTRNEATDVFFGVTKLFSCDDVWLRRMVYIVLKELATMSDDVIMVTASLTKDINSKADTMYRGNAVRALCKITPSSMLQGIERFIKQCIVDKYSSVSSAALVSALHLFNDNKEIVRRWSNEVQDTITSKGGIQQYHALGLMYLIRQQDKMAISKMVQTLSKTTLTGPLAQCLFIRYAARALDDEQTAEGRQAYLQIISGFLRGPEMAGFEAARVLCSLKSVNPAILTPVVTSLHTMLRSTKETIRFAASRTLSQLAARFPAVVSTCNLDMELLINDKNRSIATFAITTVLKTGSEDSVDRIMKQIYGFMADISDEFKVVIVDAIRSLSIKFPSKHATMLQFLSGVLKDEGGHDYKNAVVESIFDMINHIPECKDTAFTHLCEFIEDCEFTRLAVRVIHLIGREGPKSENPAKFIKYIYNRVILENAAIRGAAVIALSKFAAALPLQRASILVLLTRCLEDVDDEVRDRAVLAISQLKSEENSTKYITDNSSYALDVLERGLVAYLADSSAAMKPFDIHSVPVVDNAEEVTQTERRISASTPLLSPEIKTTSRRDSHEASAKLSQIPELAKLGNIFKSSKPVDLTEAETEYVVQCIKHIFPGHVVLQFLCKNTLNNVMLENVHARVTLTSACELQQLNELPAATLKYDQQESIYVIYAMPSDSMVTASMTPCLKFVVKECDPVSGIPEADGYEDSYEVEDLELQVSDFIIASYIQDFNKQWETLPEEVTETFALSLPSVSVAFSTVSDLLSMANISAPSDTTGPQSAQFCGIFFGGHKVLVRCRAALTGDKEVTLELNVRSTREDICAHVIGAFA